MTDEHPNIVPPDRQLVSFSIDRLPTIITDQGEDAARRFLEFFLARIRNRNTREAYARAVWRFCDWCERRSIVLHQVEPMLTSLYIDELQQQLAAPSVKQHLAAIRMLFDWLVVGQVVPTNPAAAVRGPKHVVKTGKTTVLDASEARQLLDAIPPDSIAGLRDRALIGVMVYSFARVGAVVVTVHHRHV